jgi:hypothetical protein
VALEAGLADTEPNVISDAQESAANAATVFIKRFIFPFFGISDFETSRPRAGQFYHKRPMRERYSFNEIDSVG